MTCVVAVTSAGKVFMAGDSAISYGGASTSPMRIQKVFFSGKFLVGFAGGLRFGDVVRHQFVFPEIPKRMDVEKYFSSVFADSLRGVLKATGSGSTNKHGTNRMGGELLIGYKGKIWSIGDYYDVSRSHENFDAIGAGGDYALCVLGATKEHEPRERLRRALEQSVKFCSDVSPPFIFKEIG